MDEKRSVSKVDLVIMGAVGLWLALPYLPKGNEVRRNVYSAREECVRDYSESQCESHFEGPGRFTYYGPEYYADAKEREVELPDIDLDHDSGPGRTEVETGKPNPKVASHTTSYRGGFGNLSARFGIGG